MNINDIWGSSNLKSFQWISTICYWCFFWDAQLLGWSWRTRHVFGRLDRTNCCLHLSCRFLDLDQRDHAEAEMKNRGLSKTMGTQVQLPGWYSIGLSVYYNFPNEHGNFLYNVVVFPPVWETKLKDATRSCPEKLAPRSRGPGCNAVRCVVLTQDHSATGHSKGDPRSALNPRAFTFPTAFLTCFATFVGLGTSPTWRHSCAGALCLFTVYQFFVYRWHSVRHMKAMKAMQEGLAAVRAEVKKCVAQTPMCWFWFDRMTATVLFEAERSGWSCSSLKHTSRRGTATKLQLAERAGWHGHIQWPQLLIKVLFLGITFPFLGCEGSVSCILLGIWAPNWLRGKRQSPSWEPHSVKWFIFVRDSRNAIKGHNFPQFVTTLYHVPPRQFHHI